MHWCQYYKAFPKPYLKWNSHLMLLATLVSVSWFSYFLFHFAWFSYFLFHFAWFSYFLFRFAFLIQLLLSVTWFLFANQIRTSSIFALKNVFQVPVTRGEQGAEKPETRVGHPGSRDLPDRRIASPCTTHRRLPRAGAARALNFWHGEI